MANNSDEINNNSENPSWIQASLFEAVLKEIVSGYRQIKDFKTEKVLGGGENYATIILRPEAEVELNGDDEATMYREVIPEFEKIYREAGVEVKFSPKSYTLDTEHNYILLEDLKPKGFINVNRLEGLDVEHTHAVLKYNDILFLQYV